MELLQAVQLTHVFTQEQYIFLYEVLLEGLLCGNTGIPVENIASHVRCLREAETSRHNNILEKEFKVPPGPVVLGLVLLGAGLWSLSTTAPLFPAVGWRWGTISLGWLKKGRS